MRILYIFLALPDLLLLMRPCIPGQLRRGPQRNARRANEHDVRKVPAKDIMRQRERE